MGSGLLFWGVAEPVYHFEAPPGMAGGTAQAAREAMVITNLHWGLHAWAIYGVCAMVIAYFTFRRGEPSMISTPIRHVRSEEHTSELQSLMRISYAVFCLKKKNKHKK